MSKISTRKMSTTQKNQTDWNRVDAMRDEDIDTSDIPEITPEEFARAVVRKGLKPVAGKKQITLRIDEDVLDWFKSGGDGYQTRINAVLRAYVDANNEAGDS